MCVHTISNSKDRNLWMQDSKINVAWKEPKVILNILMLPMEEISNVEYSNTYNQMFFDFTFQLEIIKKQGNLV